MEFISTNPLLLHDPWSRVIHPVVLRLIKNAMDEEAIVHETSLEAVPNNTEIALHRLRVAGNGERPLMKPPKVTWRRLSHSAKIMATLLRRSFPKDIATGSWKNWRVQPKKEIRLEARWTIAAASAAIVSEVLFFAGEPEADKTQEALVPGEASIERGNPGRFLNLRIKEFGAERLPYKPTLRLTTESFNDLNLIMRISQ
jgi:hypothetical protein